MSAESNLELEHKFLIKPGLELRLAGMGAKLTTDKKFHDVYFDVRENTLALNDHWLRKRDGRLQLKYPPEIRSSSAVLQYLECENQEVILDMVRQLLDSQLKDKELFQDALIPFVSYTTRRRSYQLAGVIIDLDQTDFGYEVGEVELMADVTGNIDVELADKKLRSVVSDLDTEIVSQGEGKMQAYLSKHHPDLYHKLKAAHVL